MTPRTKCKREAEKPPTFSFWRGGKRRAKFMQLARSWRERETRARRAPYRGMHLLSHCRVSARVQPASTPPRARTPLSSSAATAAAGSGRGTRAEGERARTAPSAGGAGNASSFGDRAPRGLGAAWSLGWLRRCSGVFQALWPAAVESGWGRGRARLRKAPLRKRGSSPDPLELPGRGPDLAGTEEAAGEPVAAGLCCAELKVACIPPALCRALCPFGLPASGATRGEGYKGTRSLMTRVPWDQAKYRREDRTAEDLCVNSISVFGGSVIFFSFLSFLFFNLFIFFF